MEQSLYYTNAMRRAFNSITPPPNFKVTIAEHDIEGIGFLEIIANEREFFRLSDFEKRRAVEYMVKVKAALEDHGALVQITRDALD
jgi:hypothetical protein